MGRKEKAERLIPNYDDKTVVVIGGVDKLDANEKALLQMYIGAGLKVVQQPRKQTQAQKDNAAKTECKEYYIGGVHKATGVDYGEGALKTKEDKEKFLSAYTITKKGTRRFNMFYAAQWANKKLAAEAPKASQAVKDEFARLDNLIDELDWPKAFQAIKEK